MKLPLRRLIKAGEAQQLLDAFAQLNPSGDLAMITCDGQLYAGSGEWDAYQLRDLLAHASGEQMVKQDNLLLQPLLVGPTIVGALAARADSDAILERAANLLLSLHQSLRLTLKHAAEKREVVRETLDRYREINLLYHIGETIGGCLDLELIPDLILQEVRSVVPANAGLVYLLSPSPGSEHSLLSLRASFGNTTEIVNPKHITTGHVQETMLNKRPGIFNLAGSPKNLEGSLPISTILCTPLITQDQVLGVLVLGRLDGQPEFTAGDEKLVMAITGQAAIAIETARLHEQEIKRQRLEEELAIGRQIQLSLLPESCPDIPGWEIAATYQSARQVGGDLYDFFQLPDKPHLLGMVIADVTGKGVPAAMFMAFSRTIMRSEARNDPSPATILRRANRHINDDIRFQLFLSAFYATLDTRSGQLIFANAGHDWPFWHRAGTGSCVQQLEAPGFLLGAFKEIRIEEHRAQIAPGDLMVFFTDGISETRNLAGEFFGEERIQAIIQDNSSASAQELVESICSAVRAFAGDAPPSDDLTLFVVKRL